MCVVIIIIIIIIINYDLYNSIHENSYVTVTDIFISQGAPSAMDRGIGQYTMWDITQVTIMGTSQLLTVIVIAENDVSPAVEVAGKGFKYYILIKRVIILYYY